MQERVVVLLIGPLVSAAGTPVAVVTGGASGIGAGITAAFGRAGYRVGVLDVAEPGDAHEAPTSDGELAFIRVDVGDEQQVEDALDCTVEAWGRLDVLVACAGIDARAPLVDTDVATWDRVQRVNARGAFLSIRAAARHMLPAGKGTIIAISSINAHLGWRDCTAYAASKGAIEALARAAAAELGPHGIRVNVVAPGSIETPMWGGPVTTEDRRIHSERAPLGRIGVPADIADVVVFLASEGARYVTGVVIPVDGGRSTTDFLPT